MPEIQSIQHSRVSVRCRFATTAADAVSGIEFCAFEFPGCERCPSSIHFLNSAGSSEDPFKSVVWRRWIAGALACKK